MSDVIIVASEGTERESVENSKVTLLHKVNGENNSGDKRIKCQVDLGSGNTQCCVPNCSTNSLSSIKKSQVTFITFPKDPSRFTEWTRAIQRPDLIPYMGKKSASNLLICSKHFSENMWVNSNTRIRRLHKNAVPEVIHSDGDDDEEVDIIAITPPTTCNSTNKGGLKIRKVSSLLTESALRESLSPCTTPRLLAIRPTPNSKTNIPQIKVRKLTTIGQRPKQTGNTEAEKKLICENSQLKSELDKNMDYILNQKTHYEGIVSKEKQKSKELEGKIEILESAQRKLWQTYEAQLQAQRSVVSSKDVGQKDMSIRLKMLQQTNDDLENKLKMEKKKVSALCDANSEIHYKLNEMKRNEPPPPPPPEPVFTGEVFKSFLEHHLQKEKILKEKVENMKMELEETETPNGQKNILLNVASLHLNHLQMSWLESILKIEHSNKRFHDHFKELCLFLYDISETVYVACMKAFDLAPLPTVREWATEERIIPTTNVNATINALYEQAEGRPTVHEGDIPDVSTLNSNMIERWATQKSSRPSKRRKWEEIDEDEYEEGRVLDEDEQINFSDEEEEEEIVLNDESSSRVPKPSDSCERAFDLPSSSQVESRLVLQPDFDFTLETEETPMNEGHDSTHHNIQIGTSMPLLVPDSPITSITNIPPNQTSPIKISKGKKVITSDASLSSSPKVVFRVIE